MAAIRWGLTYADFQLDGEDLSTHATKINDWLDEHSAEFEIALRSVGYVPDTVFAAGADDDRYRLCKSGLRARVMAEVRRDLTGQNPELAEAKDLQANRAVRALRNMPEATTGWDHNKHMGSNRVDATMVKRTAGTPIKSGGGGIVF